MTPSTDASGSADRALVSRLIAGDERALGELYDRHGGMAFSLALAIVLDPTDAEAVVAGAFAQVWRSAATFDAARGNLLVWLAAIVRARALERIRTPRRRDRALDAAVALCDEGETAGMPAGRTGAGRRAEPAEVQVLVRRSLDALPPAHRAVLELAYFGGLSRRQVAERSQEPLGTVRMRMRSGLEQLRRQVHPVAGSPP